MADHTIEFDDADLEQFDPHTREALMRLKLQTADRVDRERQPVRHKRLTPGDFVVKQSAEDARRVAEEQHAGLDYPGFHFDKPLQQ